MNTKFTRQKIPMGRKREHSRTSGAEQVLTPGFLLFSREDKQVGAKVFRDSGFNLALNNNGKAVPYTLVEESIEQVSGYLKRYPNASVQPVSDIRIVRGMHGTPRNEEKWALWGYKGPETPKA